MFKWAQFVTWLNKDSTSHRTVSDSGVFDSGDLTNGQSYNFTFSQAGSFPYHRSIHPSMKGTIVVSTSAPSTTTTTTSSGGSANPY